MTNLPKDFSMTNQAWECPRCGRINAPFNPSCFCSNKASTFINDPKAYENLIEANKITKPFDNNSIMNLLIEDFCANDRLEIGNYFTGRTIRCLKAEGVEKIGQLLSCCEHQLMKVPNLGKKSITEIKDILKRSGLELAANNYYKLTNCYSKCGSCIKKEKSACN